MKRVHRVVAAGIAVMVPGAVAWAETLLLVPEEALGRFVHRQTEPE